MKRLLPLFLLLTSAAFANLSFPGLKAIMTTEEYQRAGLDQLSAEQISVIESAIVRQYTTTVKTEVAKQTEVTRQAITEHEQRTILERFGLPDLSFSQEWRDKPGVVSKATSWVGGNSFKLENGQIWEGLEPIPFEVVGKEIEISPRPNGQFSLIVDGKNTTVRVHRIK